jgi:predicted hydrolase (HD superfamily)
MISNPKSVKNKWKDKSFAAGANREEIEQGAAELGVELWEHVANVIEAMNTSQKTWTWQDYRKKMDKD